MKMANQFLAGSALCLLMSGPALAEMQRTPAGPAADRTSTPIILAQAEEPATEEEPQGGECPPGTALSPEGECVPVEQQAPTEEPPAEEPPAPAEPPAEEQAAPEAVEPEADAPAAPAEQDAEPMTEPEAEPEPAPSEAAPADEQPAAEEPAEPQAEMPAEEAPAAEETPEPQPEAAPEAAPSAEPAPGAETGTETPAAPEAETPTEEAPAAEEPAETETPTEEPPAAQEEEAAPAEEQPAEAPATECPDGTEPAREGGGCVVIDQDVPVEEMPAEPGEEAPAPEEAGEEEALPEDAAPVLDSQKEGATDEEAAPPAEDAEQPAEAEEPAEGEQPAEEAQQPEAEEPVEPAQQEEAVVPQSDEEAQQIQLEPEQLQQEIRAIMEEEGERIELGQTPEDTRVRRAQLFDTRESVRVIEQYNDNRVIIEVNNEIYVESPDYDRIVLRDDLVYYEQLPGGRVREVVERSDGTRVITVRNRYGDVLRRVRVTPDGREYVLVYVPEDRFEDVLNFEDPALDLPPLRLTIPVSEYILEAEQVEDPDRYYHFLDQPPVEPVRRLYSLEEVRYSARVRDMVRRIDLDTIEFEFGSARIEEREIEDLEAIADAILRLLEENPAETFLIEGHTDAVGSEAANLALSDRRAEAVAMGLTNVFGVPPENLVTQGYGEKYLKIETQRPERENRRVAIRRITPLVSPVASAR